MNIKVYGVEFEVEADFDRDGRIDRISIFIGDEEVSDVISKDVENKIVQEVEAHHRENPEEPEDNQDR